GGAEPHRARRRPGRIVSLVSLSTGEEPDRVERALAVALKGLRRGSVLFVRLAPAPAEGLLLGEWPEVAARCNAFGGEFCLGAHVRETDDGFAEMKIGVREGEAEAKAALLPGLLSHMAQHFDFVL